MKDSAHRCGLDGLLAAIDASFEKMPPVEPFPSREEVAAMKLLEFLRLRVDNTEGWAYESDECRRDVTRIEAIETDCK
jgi:hypothetical protein